MPLPELLWRAGFATEWAAGGGAGADRTGVTNLARAARAYARDRWAHRRPVAEVRSVADRAWGEPLGNEPRVLRGHAAQWPAIHRWSPRWFATRYGSEEVTVGDRAHLAQAPLPLRLAELVDDIEGGSTRYLRFYPALDRHPELRADLDLGGLHRLGRVGRPWHQPLVELYLGGPGTGTDLHHVAVSNLFVQVYGQKDWVLHPPSASPVLDPVPKRAVFWTSNQDFHGTPSGPYAKAPRFEVRLDPGDVLWIPPWWWHGVANPAPSIGLSVWWAGVRAALRSPFFTTLAAFGRPGPLDLLFGRRPDAAGVANIVQEHT